MADNIYLIGFMGTGKSTVGKIIAKKTGKKFVDTDSLVELKAGMSVYDIFEQFSEEEFRKLESEVLQEITEDSGLIVSTGGGIVISRRNLEVMKGSGKLITLMASPEAIYERVKDTDERPLLEGEDPMGNIKQLIYDRAHFYIQGEHIVDTSEMSAEEAADDIIGYIGHA